MSFFNRTKADVDPQEEVLSPAEVAAQKKKETDDSIKKKLNDRAFLSFLAKNPDAAANGTDDEYLMEKIEVFENIQRVKQEAKKYITGASSSEYGSLVDDNLLEFFEEIAINNPGEFLSFSNKISSYLESVERAKEVEDTYQEIARSMGMTVNYSELSAERKREFINDVHSRMNETIFNTEVDIGNIEGDRSFTTFIPYTKSREKFAAKMAATQKLLQALRAGEQKLDKDSILASIDEVESIKTALRGNQAFEFIRAEFKKKSEQRIIEAIASKDNASLAKQMATLERLRANESILDKDECFDLSRGIDKYSRETTVLGTEGLVDNKDTVTLNSFERGIDSIRKKGIALGLSEAECDEQIANVLNSKITELENNQDAGQNRIKLILARRILINIE